MSMKREILSYEEFIKQHYPESSVNIYGDRFTLIIKQSFNNISMLRVYYECDHLDEITKSFLQDAQYYFVKLLYIMPLNDQFLADSIIRAISETFLKITYTSFLGYRDDIKKIRYRKLWEEGIKTTTQYKEHHTSLSNINNMFRTKSDTLHSKFIDYSTEADYMTEKMVSINNDLVNNLESTLNQLNFFLLEDLKQILNIDEKNFTLHQISAYKSVLA